MGHPTVTGYTCRDSWRDGTNVTAMIPVSAPPRVRTRLRNAPNGPVPVVHHGPDAVYVDVDGWCVGVVGFRATAVPCALRTSLRRCPRSPVRGSGTACCTSTTCRW